MTLEALARELLPELVWLAKYHHSKEVHPGGYLACQRTACMNLRDLGYRIEAALPLTEPADGSVVKVTSGAPATVTIYVRSDADAPSGLPECCWFAPGTGCETWTAVRNSGKVEVLYTPGATS